MQFQPLLIEGPILIRPKKIEDTRGYFMEAFKDELFRLNVANVVFSQDNQSFSAQAGTIRGLHYQKAPFGQGKLVRCLKGAIFDVAVDIRLGSATFGKWVGATLTESGAEQLWVPEGFAHGFCTLERNTEVFYKVTKPYSRSHDAGLAYDDPEIGIAWPIDLSSAVLSDKDLAQPKLHHLK